MIACRADTPPFVVTHARPVGLLLLGVSLPLGLLGSLSGRLIVQGDAVATANQVLGSEGLFRVGVASTLLLMMVDACVVVLVFYQLLRPVNRVAAMLMVVLNLLGVPITMLNELNLLAIPLSLQGVESAPEQAQASVSFWMHMHESGSAIAGLFWGVWLLPYAFLVFRSAFLPNWFVPLLILECAGFFIQSFGALLASGLDANLAALPAITSVVELVLPLWLVIKGIDVEDWQKHANRV